MTTLIAVLIVLNLAGWTMAYYLHRYTPGQGT